MSIFDEQVLEPFVARGVGTSGIASRQIQATNLPDLSAAVRQSQVTQQNLADQQKSLSEAKGMVSISRSLTQQQSGRNSGDGTKPFVIGRVKAGAYSAGGLTIAIPDGRGNFELKTMFTDQPGTGANDSREHFRSQDVLKEMGIDASKDYPELNAVGLGGKYKREDLISTLAQHSKSSGGSGISLSNILKQIG